MKIKFIFSMFILLISSISMADNRPVLFVGGSTIQSLKYLATMSTPLQNMKVIVISIQDF